MRAAAKLVAATAGALFAAPYLVVYWVSGRLVGPAPAFEGVSQSLSLLPGLAGNYVRAAFYRRTLRRCGRCVCITFGTRFSDRRAEIGENVYIGADCDLGWVAIGDDALLGSGVHVISGPHTHGIADTRIPIRLQPGTLERVTIGAGSWVGNASVVMADVGEHCVVGAGAVVTRAVPPYTVSVGSPARVLRSRQDGEAARVTE